MRVILWCAVIWLGLIVYVSYRVDKERLKIEDRIGHTYIISNDTLMVMDYSLWHNTYHLSNGKDVNFELINKLKPIK